MKEQQFHARIFGFGFVDAMPTARATYNTSAAEASERDKPGDGILQGQAGTLTGRILEIILCARVN